MKKIKKQFLFLLCSIFVVGCADDIEIIPNDSTTSLSVEKARTWYETNFMANQGSTIFKAKTTDSTALSLKPLLNWDLAQLDNDSLWSVVELPWEYENGKVTMTTSDVSEYCQRSGIQPKQILRLVILKNRKTGDVYGFKMAVIPDMDYMLSEGDELSSTNYYLKRDSRLSGLVLFYSVNGQFINGWRYINGDVIGEVRKTEPETRVNINLQKMSAIFQPIQILICGYYETPTKTDVDCYTSEYYIAVPSTSSSGGGVSTEVIIINGGGSNTLNEEGCPGTSYKDECGECVGGNTNKLPCIEADNSIDPCAEINKLKIDAALIQRLKDFIIKAKNEPIEYGYLKTTNGTFLYPIKQTFKSVSYGTYFDKITERVHTHDNIPGGGTYVFSPEDLMVLYSMYINGKMANPTTFRYIVVSAFGIGCLNITDVVAFEKFGENYNLDELKKEYDITPKSGTDMNANLKQFMDILKSTKSGLTFSLGEFEMEDTNPDIEWNTKQLDNTGNVTNYNCN